MWFRSDTQPRCRTCGKPIGKHTTSVYFGSSVERRDDYSVSRTEFPRTREEAQRLVNMQIVSLSWRRAPDTTYGRVRGAPDFDYIDRVTVWDGESYKDEFFCTNNCAIVLGRAVAAKGWACPPYHAATEGPN